MLKNLIILVAGFSAFAFFAGCSTVDTTFEPGSSPEVYFQRAQLASDQNDFELAQKIYRIFLETGISDPGYRVSAEYEIAFLDYKMGRKEAAIEGFNKILAMYEAGTYSGMVPEWPKVLSIKIMGILTTGSEDSSLIVGPVLGPALAP